MRYGYARVSSVGQNLDAQIASLERAGVEVVRQEKVSGTSLKNRVELRTLLDFVREGDELVVTRIDRLARSVADLENIVKELEEKKVKLVATEQSVDTSNAAGRMFLQLLSVFSEFETNLRRERQMEGIERAKERGVYKGRRPSIDRKKVLELKTQGMNPTEIARELQINRSSVYRVMKSA
jgi:DNA invertase Pin-like site-specific DNA recombinase